MSLQKVRKTKPSLPQWKIIKIHLDLMSNVFQNKYFFLHCLKLKSPLFCKIAKKLPKFWFYVLRICENFVSISFSCFAKFAGNFANYEIKKFAKLQKRIFSLPPDSQQCTVLLNQLVKSEYVNVSQQLRWDENFFYDPGL